MNTEADQRDRLRAVLQRSQVFASLTAEVLDALADALEIQRIEGGQVVYREGEAAESMLVVVSGRLRVSRRNADGSLRLFNEVFAGETVGEAGMILQQCRFADVTALRDSTVAILDRAAFERLLTCYPVALNQVFAQAVYRHLRHVQEQSGPRRAHAFLVVPLHAGAAADAVARGLFAAFAAHGKTLQVDWTPTTREVTDDLEAHYDYVIHGVSWADAMRCVGVSRQVDQIVLVADPAAPPECGEIERVLAADPGFAMKRRHLVLMHAAEATQPGNVEKWRSAHEVERIYPLRAGWAEGFARMARFLTGRAVGLVLGGGGARGFAHLGVLRALEEAHIPIDVIGGNSMGALIGAQLACGLDRAEILERTRRFALGGEWLTLPVISLLSGRRLERDLRRMFGDLRIEELWHYYFAAACNLSRACTTVLERGLLWQAVLASNSPAGLLPPVVRAGELLVDGAILDNVPVGAMRGRLGTPAEQRRGNGTIIAIDVDVREDLAVDPALPRLSVRKTLRRYFSASEESCPGIGDILYRAGHIGGLHQQARTQAMADRYLEPPVAGFSLMAYRQAEDIVEVGYRYAVEEIARWTNPVSTD